MFFSNKENKLTIIMIRASLYLILLQHFITHHKKQFINSLQIS